MPPDRTLKSPSPPSSEPGTILFETERLICRRYLLSDAPAVAEKANYPVIGSALRDGFPSPYTLANAEMYLGRQIDPNRSSYPWDAALFLKPNSPGNPSPEPDLIGSVGIKPGDDVNYRTWELGYWLTPSAWGQGYATEATTAFVRYVFATWPTLNRVEAFAYENNKASARVLQKSGFTREGVKRGSCEKGGVLWDEVIFGIVRSDLK